MGTTIGPDKVGNQSSSSASVRLIASLLPSVVVGSVFSNARFLELPRTAGRVARVAVPAEGKHDSWLPGARQYYQYIVAEYTAQYLMTR